MGLPRVDTLVVGSGIAGLFTALKLRRHGRVAVITKAALEESNTRYAQGGIAAAWFPDDAPALHERDTLAAGAGLSDPEAVRGLCEEAPARIADLLAYGVEFDRENGELARGLEAAHSRPRILHAGGDATGARIERALAAAVRAAEIPCYERHFVLDLIVEGGRATGVRLLDAEGRPQEVRAQAVVLAAGGAGQVYQHTTNPRVATGDGVAAAARAGAWLADLEFFQFHPTALALPGLPTFLISEAVRGEGGVLRDRAGRRFLLEMDPRGELAPRDVVARAIAARMAEQGGEPVLLDITHLDPAHMRARFPRIDAFCREHGLDWTREPIPVAPAAHYWMGGVLTNTWGETSLPGLYACGEAACTGVHGANRLASNSLLEGIVFGARIAERIAAACSTPAPLPLAVGALVRPLPASPGPSSDLPLGGSAVPRESDGGERIPPLQGPGEVRATALRAAEEHVTGGGHSANGSGRRSTSGPASVAPNALRAAVQRLAWERVGLVRDARGLSGAIERLAAWEQALPAPTSVAMHEDRNLLQVARLIAEAALLREESRGAHYRADFPATDPAWARRIVWQPATVRDLARAPVPAMTA